MAFEWRPWLRKRVEGFKQVASLETRGESTGCKQMDKLTDYRWSDASRVGM
jgi:hypothetical protein